MKPTNTPEDQIEPTIEHRAPRRQPTGFNNLHLTAALAVALGVGAVGGAELIAKPALQNAEKAQKKSDEVMKIAELAKSSLEQAIRERDEARKERDKAATAADSCASANEVMIKINKDLHQTICKVLASGHPEVVQQTMCKPEEPEEQPQPTKNNHGLSL